MLIHTCMNSNILSNFYFFPEIRVRKCYKIYSFYVFLEQEGCCHMEIKIKEILVNKVLTNQSKLNNFKSIKTKHKQRLVKSSEQSVGSR